MTKNITTLSDFRNRKEENEKIKRDQATGETYYVTLQDKEGNPLKFTYYKHFLAICQERVKESGIEKFTDGLIMPLLAEADQRLKSGDSKSYINGVYFSFQVKAAALMLLHGGSESLVDDLYDDEATVYATSIIIPTVLINYFTMNELIELNEKRFIDCDLEKLNEIMEGVIYYDDSGTGDSEKQPE
jgi:hypothetical protein